ncbi:MAG TPA: hypothetical protein VGN23_12910 [Verrucomicrobiae bacterium]
MIKPNQAFAWRKGLRLIPSERVILVFPGALIQGEELIGDIIEVSDNADIGFQKSENPEEIFSHIVLKVAKGDGICLNRSTEAILVCDTDQPVAFEVGDQ